MKIAIIEGGYHFEVVRSYALMLLNSGHTVTIFTNTITRHQLTNVLENKVTWMGATNLSFTEYLNEQISGIDNHDFIICTSPQSHDGFFIQKTWTSKTFLVVHDVHNDYDVWHHLSIRTNRSITNLLKSIKYYFNRYYRRRLTARLSFDGVIFPSVCMYDYAKMNYGLKNAMVLPFLWNERISPINETEIIKITIPGTLKQRSRDYNYCITLLRSLSQQINTKLQLHLLGQTITDEAKKIKQQFLSLENDAFEVVTYDGTIDQETYDEVLFNSDLLLLPLQKKWQFGIVDEVGGLTCLSGNIGDMVRFAVPSVLPFHYALSEELEPLVLRITMEDVKKDVGLLKEIIEKKTFNTIKSNTTKIVEQINKQFSIPSQK